MSERYGGFTFRVTCRHCGQPGPVNLPAQEHACAFCQETTAIPPTLFGDLLEMLDDEYRELSPGEVQTYEDDAEGVEAVVSYRRVDKPLCEKCKQPYRDESIADGSARDIFCASCGDPASTAPVPAWLVARVPTARQLVSVHRGTAGGAGVAPEIAAEAAQPIAMACPSCGAGLTITHEHARTTPCTFCNVSVYLPDPLWRKLHPVRTVQEWFVGFEGETAREKARAKTREAEAWAEERRAQGDTTEAAGSARGFVIATAVLGGLHLAYLVAGLAFGLAPAPGSWITCTIVPLSVQLTVAVAAVSHSLAVIRARVGNASKPFETRVGWAALLCVVPLPIGVALYRGLHQKLMKIPRMKAADLTHLGAFFVIHTILVPLQFALLVPHYLTLGSCPEGQSFNQQGACFRCGGSSEPACYGAKGRRTCRAPAFLINNSSCR